MSDDGEIAIMEEGNNNYNLGKIIEMVCQWMHLSICSAGGLTQPQTMELKRKLHGQEIVILIDNGASHNFISG